MLLQSKFLNNTLNDMKKKTGVIIKSVIWGIVCLILVYVIISVIASKVKGEPLPTVFGYGACFVVSGSMEPTLSIDDVIIVKESDNLKIGDIVLYKSNNSLVVHRVKGFLEGGQKVVTRGDANNTDDTPFDRSQIVGKVVGTIPWLGQIIIFLKSSYGIIAFVSLIVLIYATTYLIRNKNCKQDS